MRSGRPSTPAPSTWTASVSTGARGRSAFAPRIADASTESEVDAILAEMVGLLGDGNAEYVVPASEAVDEAGAAGIGFLSDHDATDDRSGMRVVYVMPDSPAERAGLRDRDTILAVDGDLCPRRSIIRGDAGASLKLVVRSPGERPRTVMLSREVIDPKVVAQARMLRDDGAQRIGYVRMANLDAPGDAHEVLVGLSALLADGPLDGLVLDLRATGGGNGSAVNGIAAQFIAGTVARTETREGTSDWVLPEGEFLPRLKDTALSLLIDERTSGVGETLAGILHGSGRAVTVGTRTDGQSRAVEGIELPAGRMLGLATWRDVLLDGSPITPVWPDIEVAADWLDESESSDSGIAAALDTFGGYSIGPAPRDFILIPLACGGHACPERIPTPTPEPH